MLVVYCISHVACCVGVRSPLKEWNMWKSMKIGFISFMTNNLQKPKYVNVWKTEVEDGSDEGRSQNAWKKVAIVTTKSLTVKWSSYS